MTLGFVVTTVLRAVPTALFMQIRVKGCRKGFNNYDDSDGHSEAGLREAVRTGTAEKKTVVRRLKNL